MHGPPTPLRTAINVNEILDGMPFTGLQVTTFALCLSCLIMDGFDVQALGYTAPSIIGEWGVANAALGPVFAAGNSDGDQQMLEWTQGGSGARLMMLVHHDDAEREWAYGAESKIGTFSDSLMAEAKKRDWVVISMKNDWKRIFAFEQ